MPNIYRKKTTKHNPAEALGIALLTPTYVQIYCVEDQ
ncbi:MAG: hypothetical protein JWL63_2408 [Rhodocyclales bacterium]|nr:hypothetical protein [Rhodocyclales bacterium]